MAEIIEHIPKLKGIDAEIFLHNLEKDITEEEIRAVRIWALGTESNIKKYF
jgi:precorrin-6B methylase 2